MVVANNWLFAIFTTLSCSLADLHLRSFEIICAHLRPTAFKMTAFGNCRFGFPEIHTLFAACLFFGASRFFPSSFDSFFLCRFLTIWAEEAMMARDVTGSRAFCSSLRFAIFSSFWGNFLTRLHRQTGQTNGEVKWSHSSCYY